MIKRRRGSSSRVSRTGLIGSRMVTWVGSIPGRWTTHTCTSSATRRCASSWPAGRCSPIPCSPAGVGALRRVVPLPDPAAWAGVDLVLISHLHGDHLHLPSLRRLGRDVRIVVPRGAGRWLRRRGFPHVAELGARRDADRRRRCASPASAPSTAATAGAPAHPRSGHRRGRAPARGRRRDGLRQRRHRPARRDAAARRPRPSTSRCCRCGAGARTSARATSTPWGRPRRSPGCAAGRRPGALGHARRRRLGPRLPRAAAADAPAAGRAAAAFAAAVARAGLADHGAVTEPESRSPSPRAASPTRRPHERRVLAVDDGRGDDRLRRALRRGAARLGGAGGPTGALVGAAAAFAMTARLARPAPGRRPSRPARLLGDLGHVRSRFCAPAVGLGVPRPARRADRRGVRAVPACTAGRSS